MRFYLGMIMVIALLLTGCANNQTVSVEGEIHGVDHENNTVVVYVGDTLTENQMETMDFDENEKNIEAFLVQAEEDTVVKGEVDSFNDLKMEQKVSIEIKGNYEKELVTIGTLFENHEKLPAYDTEKVEVIPYSKVEIVEGMTVDKGKYGLYVYNPKTNEKSGYDAYPGANEDFRFQRLVMTHANSVKNTKELLGLYDDSPTYIITDDKGIIFKSNKEKELNAFVKKLGETETN
ncbi:hypothetical protein SAMN05216232_2166 [Virgibacillus subterraneus]|uniref:Lipoprotein n=1 Tax=Virgibacillus subterraneus TaxID=621109 RepID=A0A1H9FE23_9BACI|nr:hypothetical protein [Virgibacillus subterraneus]SEQ36167.1 hypothetical protein SAMN05216232_2166 [Virgibacillus subterraneus]